MQRYSVLLTQAQIDSQIIVDFQLAFIKRPDWKPDTGVGTLADHDEREYYDKQPPDRCDIQGCCGNDVVMRFVLGHFRGRYILTRTVIMRSMSYHIRSS